MLLSAAQADDSTCRTRRITQEATFSAPSVADDATDAAADAGGGGRLLLAVAPFRNSMDRMDVPVLRERQRDRQ